MIVNVLVDNKKNKNRPEISSEKGVSFHIQTKQHSIIFDMGGSHVFCDNAKHMGVDIDNVNIGIISHRHHDHANGLPYFLRCNKFAKVYFRKSKQQHYIFKLLGIKINVGLNASIIEKNKNRLIFINKTTEVLPNIFTVINSCNIHPKPDGNKYLFSNTKKGLNLDSFDHELFLVIREIDGLVIFCGCAHSGVLNMIETTINIFTGEKIKAVIGGFHLVGVPILNGLECRKKDTLEIGKKLECYPIERFYTGHCTGLKGYQELKSILGDRIKYLSSGSRLHI